MDPEEARRKHAELAKMRHLMFYEEMRAKRAKKIKSRAYRKLKKKERQALELQEEEGLSSFEAKERLRKQQGNRAR
jgi:U3 small nucleolar RNA-associated protein 14